MWTADRWNSYKVLDTSNGEKLERWGGYTLIRPDPQVIWTSGRSLPGWRKPDAHYHRSQKGGGDWEFFSLPEQWSIDYQLPPAEDAGGPASEIHGIRARALTFHLKPFKFKHTGVFPEQAVNWDFSFDLISKRIQSGRPVKVLNLFAYTGGATLAAAAAGASVTHVDAAKGMVAWARENAASSGLSEAPIRWLVDDCGKFIDRELRRGNHYDAIIMDPPSYGRGPSGEIWKIEDDIFPFIERCAGLLSDDPLFFLINSYTTGLQPGVLKYMLELSVEKRFGGRTAADELGIPVEGTGSFLPCGACGRWVCD